MSTMTMDVSLRDTVQTGDARAVRDIVAATGFFHPEEVDVAVELVDDRLKRGPASDYHFVFADIGGSPAGYACYGAIACTKGSFDLYWIAVHPSRHGRGLGRLLLEESERRARAMGGRRMYIETSSRPLYEPTRGFYLRCGYAVEAVLRDFYAPGDGKVIYGREISDCGTGRL